LGTNTQATCVYMETFTYNISMFTITGGFIPLLRVVSYSNDQSVVVILKLPTWGDFTHSV